MSESHIVLCPGQGAQHVGMGQAWYQQSSVARQMMDEADRILGLPLTKLCLEGPVEELNRTDLSQPAIFAVSAACHMALHKAGGLEPLAATAGLSLGEFTALHLAGAFDFETGLKLVRLRGQAMQQAAEASPSGMVALVGASDDQAYDLCQQVLADPAAKPGEVLVPANFNCPGQVVISGSLAACDRSLSAAEKMGLRATALKVAGAFHSPLMQPAADRLAEALDRVTWHTPRAIVLSNVDGKPHDGAKVESVKRLLVAQLTSPVRWGACMQWIIQNVKGQCHELAPGKVLSGLMRRIDRQVAVQSHAEPG